MRDRHCHVADARATVLHPARPHAPPAHRRAAGGRRRVAPDLIRLSVGIEDAGDIIADIAWALAAR
ncbi:MAG: PLP-dependent transferase [Alistipes indistinctus]